MALYRMNVEEVRVRALSKGMTPDEIAEVAGVSRASIFRANHGYQTTTKVLVALARALECDPAELIKRGGGQNETEA